MKSKIQHMVDLSSLSETIKEVNQQLREKNDDLEKLKIDYSLKEKMIKDIQKINQQLKKDEDTYQRYLDLYNLASVKIMQECRLKDMY